MTAASSASGPPDILVFSPRRDAGEVRRALEEAGLEPRYRRPPSGDHPGTLEASPRPDLVLFPLATPPERLADQVRAVRDLWPDIPVVVEGEGFDPALSEALAARDTGFVTQTVLTRLISAVEQGVRMSAERTRRREAEDTVRMQRSELVALVDTAPDLIAQFDEDFRFTYVNRAIVRLTDREEEQFLGRTRAELGFPAVEQATWESAVRTVFESGTEVQLEFSHRHDERGVRVFEARLAPEAAESGRVRRAVLVGRDVTEQRERERRIEYLSRHDPLTDLPNRRVLRERLGEAVHRARRGRPSTLLFLDVDNFKFVNDEIGHEAGDDFLVGFSAWLRDTVRPIDLVARAGGDEFAVLLEDTDRSLGREIAERLRRTSTEFHFMEGGFVFRPTLTVGAASVEGEIPEEGSEDELLRRAEIAMRRGKEAGKARVVFYRPEWGNAREVGRARQWLSRLRAALEEDRLEVYLQPIHALDGRGRWPPTYEALVRLREDGEILSPSLFLSDAERFGLVAEIDRWMLASVLGLLHDREDDVRIAVNLSGKSVGVERLARDLSTRGRGGLNGLRGLVLEVTETSALHHFADAQEWMRGIHELGVPFVLDDFGSGFSSFSYLERLPVEAVKIDGRFIANLQGDASCRAIVTSIVDVCHALRRQVVAESVEDAETLEILRSVGVDAVQGFHMGEPRPASEVLV